MRIQPASYFARTDLNGAVRDDERRLPLSFALSTAEIRKLVLNPQDVPDVTPDQRVDVSFQSPADYWIYCVTESIDPRLFVDFEADACVVIRDRKAFAERLQLGAGRALGRVRSQAQLIEYIDPLLPKTAKMFLPLSKHFGYSYQSEFRFCWFPVEPLSELPSMDISIGSIEDIADLIVL
jgi:hypothetical protein